MKSEVKTLQLFGLSNGLQWPVQQPWSRADLTSSWTLVDFDEEVQIARVPFVTLKVGLA